MSLATNKNGHQLLSFLQSSEPIPSVADAHIPIPFALVVATYKGKALVIYNTWREVWELPWGMIDKCESLADAAKRELREETAQIAETLAFVGLAKMKLKPDDRLEFGAIYACELERVQPFVANNEASKLMWWDVSSELEEHITAIDRKLIEMTVGYLAI